MPIIIPKDIPAYNILHQENIFVMNELRANSQDIRPIEILILNLMPTKIETETQLLRLLSNSPLQVNVTFLKTSRKAKNTSQAHLDRFYKSFSQIKKTNFDGMIITGAPVENLEFEQVDYWQELCAIFEYSKTHVTSTMFICWSAQAGLYYFYGLKKKNLPKKISGIFAATKTVPFDPLLKGCNDVMYFPHSRYTFIPDEDIYSVGDLEVLAHSEEAKSCVIKARGGKMFFLTGHSEYARDTLKNEFFRDLARGIECEPPEHYFVDDTFDKINFNWSSTANLIFSNWLNYYVYQVTPFNIGKQSAPARRTP